MVTRRDYTAEGVGAARSVLIELVHLLGEYKDDMVLIGGWIPEVLLPHKSGPHVGSMDVDLALNHKKIRDEAYKMIQDLLKSRGYQQGEQPFIFFRSDGSKQKLEDCLNDFMIGLVRASCVLRSVELQRERWAQERRDQELQRIEMEAKIKEEQEQFEALIEAVDNWHTSNRISEYIEAVRNKAIREHGVVATGSDLEEWIIWAAKQADRLDPFVK